MELIVNPHGRARCVYSDEIDLFELGQLTIRRASHVEPGEDGQWWADLSPVNGPKLGPFMQRRLALEAETTWLAKHWLVGEKEDG